MGQKSYERSKFLRSLLRDKTANTIVISAAALVPLMAMIGGGVDASRYYRPPRGCRPRATQAHWLRAER